MAERTDKLSRRKGGAKKPAGRKPKERAGPTGPSVGQRLREQREKKGLSIKDAAREMHLDHWMLEALERDDYQALGAPVFAKGHLRKYAALLELPGDEMMIAYYQSENVSEMPPIVAETLIRARLERPGRFVRAAGVALIVLLVAGAVAWWWLGRSDARSVDAGTAAPSASAVDRRAPLANISRTLSTQRPAQATPAAAASTGAPDIAPAEDTATSAEATAPVPMPADAGPVATDSAEAMPEAIPEEVPDATAPQASPSPSAVTPAVTDDTGSAATADGRLRLRLRFDDDSWVEISDGDGNRMLYGMGSAGTSRSLTGRPPVQVFLGRARGVRLEVNGEPYTIPPAGLRGNTARFQIDLP